MDVAQRCGSIRRQRRRRTVRGKLSQPLLAALNPGWIPPDAPPRAEEWALHQIRLALQDGEIPVRWAQLRWPATTTFIPGTLFSADRPPEMGPFWTHVFVYPAQDYAVAQEAYPLVGGFIPTISIMNDYGSFGCSKRESTSYGRGEPRLLKNEGGLAPKTIRRADTGRH